MRKTNADRQIALRDLFIESGCPQDRLVEQRVKGSKFANVICALSRAPIVGAARPATSHSKAT